VPGDPGMPESRLPPTPRSTSRAGWLTGRRSHPAQLVDRITAPEWIIGSLVGALMLVVVVLEPDVLEAPVENARTILFTVGGRSPRRSCSLSCSGSTSPRCCASWCWWVPFAIVSWRLISPYFRDDVVDEVFLDLDRGAGRRRLRTGNPQLH
jgi:hypothetical protein